MAGVNKVILIGNLGSDPEVKNLPSGSKLASFSLATSESYTNKAGKKVTQTEWHKIECWEGLAGVSEQYLKKGDTIYLEGKLRTDEWQDKNGNNKATTKIRVSSMTMLGSKSQGPGAAKKQASPAQTYSSQDNDLPL